MIDRDATEDVLLGFCHHGTLFAGFMNSVLGAFAEDTKRPYRRLVEYHDATGPYIHDNRSRIARYFLEHTSFQWLWMVDNDMEFGPRTLYRLLEVAEEEDIRLLGAAYWNQYGVRDRYLSWLAFTPMGIKAIPELPEGDDPVEVTAVGMGCTLIHRDVVRDVADMYANDPWDTFGADILLQFEDGGFMVGRVPEDFDRAIDGRAIRDAHRMGEDVTFCIRARRAGYITYGLPSLTVEHFKATYLAHGRDEAPELLELSPKEA